MTKNNAQELTEDIETEVDEHETLNESIKRKIKQTKVPPSKARYVAYLEAQCPKLVVAAVSNNKWDDICNHVSPTLAAEQFAVSFSIKDKADTLGVVKALKRVKRHLIYTHMSVLDAFERSQLATEIEFCNKQDAISSLRIHNSEMRFKDTL